MIKLDIATSQIVWYKGEQGVIRSISKSGREIGLSLETGEFITVSPEDLIDNCPDIVYERVDEEVEDDPCGLMKWIREEEERGEFDD